MAVIEGAGTSPARVVGAGSSTEERLASVRANIQRVPVSRAFRDLSDGFLLVDIRSAAQLSESGVIPGAVHVPIDAVDSALRPDSPDRLLQLKSPSQQVLIICHSGYNSSFVTERLVSFGLRNVADVIGGFVAWSNRGFPVEKVISTAIPAPRAG